MKMQNIKVLFFSLLSFLEFNKMHYITPEIIQPIMIQISFGDNIEIVQWKKSWYSWHGDQSVLYNKSGLIRFAIYKITSVKLRDHAYFKLQQQPK